MELEYYKDIINLNDMSLTEEIEDPIFDDLIKKIKIVFKRLNINTDGKKVYYKRNNKGQSVIGIQIANEEDLSSYIVFDCYVEGCNGSLLCNVNVHADRRHLDLAGPIINLISSEVISSFEGLEYHINSDPWKPKEISLMKQITKKKINVLRRIFGKQ